MRTLLVLASLAGCSHPSGPRWPQRETPAVDGGESLAPHMARSIAAATIEEDKPLPQAAVVAPVAAAPDVVAPAVVTPGVTPPEEPITTEEIVIEVDE